jgi:hypothetical protein
MEVMRIDQWHFQGKQKSIPLSPDDRFCDRITFASPESRNRTARLPIRENRQGFEV